MTDEKRLGHKLTLKCARCETVADVGTQECPSCGYRPQKSMRINGAVIFIVGLLLSVVLIGVPIALLGAYRMVKSRELTIDSEYGV